MHIVNDSTKCQSVPQILKYVYNQIYQLRTSILKHSNVKISKCCFTLDTFNIHYVTIQLKITYISLYCITLELASSKIISINKSFSQCQADNKVQMNP